MDTLPHDAQDVRTFFDNRVNLSARTSLDQALEAMRKRLAWLQRNACEVDTYLRAMRM